MQDELALGLTMIKPSQVSYQNVVLLICLRFVDAGGSPDVFLGGVTRTALSDNQAAAGKVAALGCAAHPDFPLHPVLCQLVSGWLPLLLRCSAANRCSAVNLSKVLVHSVYRLQHA